MLGFVSSTEIIDGIIRNALGTMLEHFSALPVPMLRQVSVPGSKMMKNLGVFEVFHCLRPSGDVLRL